MLVTGKVKKTTDTVEIIALDITDCNACQVILRDLTDSLRLTALLVQVVTPAEDVYYDNTFVGYRGGHLEKFEMQDTDSNGIKLQRANDSTLTGLIGGRDDVVDAYESNFPVSVDLKTFKINHLVPETQYIGFRTAAAESFRAHRVINGLVDSSLVEVKTGDSLRVDTVYRPLKKVRLSVGDSVLVEVKIETVKKKVRHLMVG